MNILSLRDVSFSYDGRRFVLKNINASFDKGRIYAIAGESGSGKTTLLSLIAGLTRCESGKILYNGVEIQTTRQDKYRSKEIGVVFQSYNLLLTDNAVENVVLSLNLSGSKEKNKELLAYRLLENVGINKDTANRKILKLSGGEQQRVAIARSLCYNPNLVIADEPTGNLDEKNERGIMDIFTKIAHDDNKCVIIVTHSKSVAACADKLVEISHGHIC